MTAETLTRDELLELSHGVVDWFPLPGDLWTQQGNLYLSRGALGVIQSPDYGSLILVDCINPSLTNSLSGIGDHRMGHTYSIFGVVNAVNVGQYQEVVNKLGQEEGPIENRVTDIFLKNWPVLFPSGNDVAEDCVGVPITVSDDQSPEPLPISAFGRLEKLYRGSRV
jgi:hypothetical protein